MGGKTVFICPCDTYVGGALARYYDAKGWKVYGAVSGSHPNIFERTCPVYTARNSVQTPSLLPTAQLPPSEEQQAMYELLLMAQLAIFHLPSVIDMARDALLKIAHTQVTQEYTFIGISSPMTWACTTVNTDERAMSGPSEEAVVQGDTTSSIMPEPDRRITNDWLSVEALQRRRPAHGARSLHRLEQLLGRMSRPGRLRCHCVCPGLVYGQGEHDDEGGLHQWFRTAWEAKEPLTVHSNVDCRGTNVLPTIHVADLVQYVAILGDSPQASQSYWLAVDNVGVSQLELVQTISSSLGTGDVRLAPADTALLQPSLLPYLLDLKMQRTELAGPIRFNPSYHQGILANFQTVKQEYLNTRNLQPLRILIMGPPYSGKTHLAARLAELYHLPHLRPETLVEAAKEADPELLKVIQSELSSKDGRISARNMALVTRQLLTAMGNRNRGYVLEAWPKSLLQARHLYMKMVPDDEAPLAPPEPVASRAVSPMKGPKGPRATSPPAHNRAAKGTAASDRTGKGLGQPDDVVVPEGMKLELDPLVFPNYLIELDPPEEELQRRLKVVMTQEPQGTTRGASGGTPPSAGGARATRRSTLSLNSHHSHHNERDFARRLEAYHLLRQQDQLDLDQQRQMMVQQWMERQGKVSEGPAASPTISKGGTLGRRQEVSRSPTTNSPGHRTTKSSRPTTPSTPQQEVPSPDEGGPVLPQYGGFVGFFVEGGARYLKLPSTREDVPPMPSSVTSQRTASGSPAPLPLLEEQLIQTIGGPHNYEGCTCGEAVVSGNGEEQNHNGSGLMMEPSLSSNLLPTPDLDRVETAEVDSKEVAMPSRASVDAELAAAKSEVRDHLMKPLKDSLMCDIHSVIPVVTRALADIAASRPDDPVKVLADYLLAAADEQEARYKSPYEDPIYHTQEQKWAAKRERESGQPAASINT